VHGTPALAVDPTAGADLYRANETASRLMLSGRANESLPWMRRQIALLDRDDWEARKDYATALHNAALESRADRPATRSSFERIALVRESFHQLDLAESLTDAPSARAALLSSGAHTMWIWGMQWDALVPLERAIALPGARPELAPWAGSIRATMEHPVNPVATSYEPPGPG